MTRSPMQCVACGLIGLVASNAALAHSFGQVYNLPVPVWLYLYGAAGALVLSFVVIGYFISGGGRVGEPPTRDIGDTAPVRLARRLRLMTVLKAGSLLALLACVITGFMGTPNPYGNFSMTFFWIVFVLGFTYLTALIGDLYASINPWRTLAEGVDRLWRGFTCGRVRYPARLGYWPALTLYMGFIWLELLGETGPFSLAVLLSAYTALNLGGVWLVGVAAWFRYCEFFAVFFRLIAAMAPVEYRPGRETEDGRSRLRLRPPFTGLLQQRAESVSLLVFVLFMLSSTAFDGLHETAPWRRLFWVDLYRGLLQDWVGRNPLVAYPSMSRIYGIWQGFWLLASPFVYLAVYWLFIALAKLFARSREPVRALALRFVLSLLPIVLVYHFTHYYTLMQTQGVKIIQLASDPLGRGWNLLGTADWLQRAIVPDPGTVWHVQVGLIVAGHVVAVYVAHLEALRTFASHRQATLSQLPMLFLMVLFTAAGLWILAQPIAGG